MDGRNYFSVNSILLAFLWLFLLQCDDGPSKPPPYVSDYDIYVRDFANDYGKFYIFNTRAMAIVDSFDLPFPSMSPVLSPDGDRLFLPSKAARKTAVIDLQSRSLITELPAGGYNAAISPDNLILAVFGDTVYFFDASNYSELYQFSSGLGMGVFSKDAKFLYCPTDAGDLVLFDLRNMPPSSDTITYPGGLPSIFFYPDEKGQNLFTMTIDVRRYIANFEVYNLSNDTVTFSHRLSASSGFINTTPDYHYAVYSEFEPYIQTEDKPSPNTLTVYDIKNMNVKTVIPTFGIDPDHSDGLPVGKFVFTPDGKWLVGAGYGFVVIDMESMRLHRIVDFPVDRIFFQIACRVTQK